MKNKKPEMTLIPKRQKTVSKKQETTPEKPYSPFDFELDEDPSHIVWKEFYWTPVFTTTTDKSHHISWKEFEWDPYVTKTTPKSYFERKGKTDEYEYYDDDDDVKDEDRGKGQPPLNRYDPESRYDPFQPFRFSETTPLPPPLPPRAPCTSKWNRNMFGYVSNIFNNECESKIADDLNLPFV